MTAAAPIFDVARIRADFPALQHGAAHFDSPGGTQTPRAVIGAIEATLRSPLANRGSNTPAERNAETAVLDARQAIADLVAGDPTGVVFGRSATQLTMDMARTLAGTWGPRDEVVVTRLDHDANIRPWIIAAGRAGATVRWADFDPTTGELTTQSVADLLTSRTRLVAVSAASNLIGTKPEVRAIATAAHEAGALVYVDGVHYAAHALVDVTDLGADFFVCSPYKFFGPHLAALIADPALLETLRPDKLLPSTSAVPERFELGTLPYELLAGTSGAVDYLAGLTNTSGSRRERLGAARAAVDQHEKQLRDWLVDGLRDRGAVLYSLARDRTSTVLFDLPGQPAAAVARRLAQLGVNAPAGSFYAIEASRHLGLGDTGAVRVGITCYNDGGDVARLLDAIDRLGQTG